MSEAAIVALVGRPNVGKSTLFNRLISKRESLVHETAHTTRDMKFGDWELDGGICTIVDTCGIGEPPGEAVRAAQERSWAVICSAQCVIFVLDGREEWTNEDERILDGLRARGIEPIVVANKIDDGEIRHIDVSVYEHGLDPMPLSGQHGIGIMDLEDRIMEIVVPVAASTVEDDISTRMSIVGRPNVGKSTLFNMLLGKERSVVSSEAGTTVDTIEEAIDIAGVHCHLIDTAGARKKTKIDESLEQTAVGLSLQGIRRSHYVVCMLDAEEGLTQQDVRILHYAWTRNRALLIVANRIDLSPYGEDWKAKIADQIDRVAPQLKGVPIVALSALTGKRVDKMEGVLETIIAEARTRIRTSELNDWLAHVQVAHAPKLVAKGSKRARRRPKFYYGVQVRVEPVTLKLYANFPDAITEGYRRYLVRSFKQTFNLHHIPIALDLVDRRPNLDDKT